MRSALHLPWLVRGSAFASVSWLLAIALGGSRPGAGVLGLVLVSGFGPDFAHHGEDDRFQGYPGDVEGDDDHQRQDDVDGDQNREDKPAEDACEHGKAQADSDRHPLIEKYSRQRTGSTSSATSMTTRCPTVLVLLAHGAEEMETTIIVDVLRRAEIEVTLAGVSGAEPVICSRGVRILPDLGLEEVRGEFDLLVLPGGLEGSERLSRSDEVAGLLRRQHGEGRKVAAICAAPCALVAHGVFEGYALTSHPSVREAVSGHGQYREDAVVVDRELITGRGPGSSFEFALALVGELLGSERADELRGPMVLGEGPCETDG